VTTTVADRTAVRWEEPAGLNPRGTLAVFPGRGESADVYRRFAARLSADAYRVTVLEASDEADAVAQLRALVADEWAVAPVAVVGSDTGALHALSSAAAVPDGVAAAIVAGLPVGADLPERSWEAEIELRTGCPTHQGVLRSAARGIFSGVDAIEAADLVPAAPGVPVLAVHGSADEISPLGEALDRYSALPEVTVAVIEDGRHDILNDVTHRSVAATVVLFLERLRLGATLPVIVRDAYGR
jgi:alpha-beta hydrolase superfamily lysophospholipase